MYRNIAGTIGHSHQERLLYTFISIPTLLSLQLQYDFFEGYNSVRKKSLLVFVGVNISDNKVR